MVDVQKVLEERRNYWPMTPRQVLYVLTAYGWSKKIYNGLLIPVLAKMRRAKMIPWEALTDAGISDAEPRHYESVPSYISEVRQHAESFTLDRQVGQDVYIEVHCEAEGMVQQVYGWTYPYSVGVHSSGGQQSLPYKRALVDRVCGRDVPTLVLYMGDRDKRGDIIFENVRDDVTAFVEEDRTDYNHDVRVEFVRVALTPEQAVKFNVQEIAGQPGEYQLEAMPVEELRRLVVAAIEENMDLDLVERIKRRQVRDRKRLTKMLNGAA